MASMDRYRPRFTPGHWAMAERAFNYRTDLSDTAPFRRLDLFRFGGSPDVIVKEPAFGIRRCTHYFRSKPMAKDREEEKNGNGKLKRKEYEKELHRLQVELCHLQAWVKEAGARIILIFEGRDGAGKGGTIRAITERVSPRVFRVVALPAP